MMLDLKTAQYYLECYGTDVSRWPEPEVGKTALAVYARDLASALTQAQQLDAALKAVPISRPSDLLARRIMSNLPAQDRAASNENANDTGRKNHGFRSNWRAVAAAFIMIGAIGFTALSLQIPSNDTAAEAEIWREAALDMGVDDVFDWVYSEEG